MYAYWISEADSQILLMECSDSGYFDKGDSTALHVLKILASRGTSRRL